MFYPLSLIAISVTSCCVGLSLRSRDSQTGNGNGRCEDVTLSKRQQQQASCDDAAEARFCEMNCDSPSTLDRSSTRRTRLPPVPPAPVNHVDQSQRLAHLQFQKCLDDSEGNDTDRRRASPANSLLLSRSNSRTKSRPSKCHPDIRCSLSSASYVPVDRAATSSAPAGPVKTVAGDDRRSERVERCVDLCLFVLLVLLCAGLAVFLVFVSF